MNIKKKLFNLVKEKYFVSFIFVMILILGFSFLNVNKSFACSDDDGFYDCNQNYQCNNPAFPVLIGDQCYATENNDSCVAGNCQSLDTDVQYYYTQNCNRKVISVYQDCITETQTTQTTQTPYISSSSYN